MLTVQLIGQPAFTFKTQSLVKLNTHYFEALLGGILLDRSRRLSREELGFRFWPAHDELSRRRNLRQLLYRLREVWPESVEYLVMGADVVSWRGDSPCWLDVERLEYMMSLAPSYEGLDVVWTLHRGVLMAGHQERWIIGRRREFNLALQRYFRLAIAWAESLREYELCLRCLESLVLLTPERDELWVELARGYSDQGAFDRLEEAGFRYTQARAEAETPPSEQVLALFKARPLRPSHPATPPATTTLRNDELEALLHLWSTARQGIPAFALVRGLPGMGKTWLLQLLQRSVENQLGQVLFHACYEGLSNAPYAALSGVMRELAPSALPAGWIRPSLSSVVKEGGFEEATQDLSTLSQIDRLALLRRIQAGINSKLPLLLILDDIHWCDRSSLEMLSALLLDRSDMRFMLVGSVNSMSIVPADPVGFRRLLDDLLTHRGGTCISLEPLAPSQTATLIRDLCENRVNSETISLIIERSEGIPQVVHELLWELNILPVPLRKTASFRKKVQHAFDGISREARELGMIAAMIGPKFDFETLSRLVGSSVSLEGSLDELFSIHFLREFPDGQLGWVVGEIRAAVCDVIRGYKRLMIQQRIAALMPLQ